MELTAAPELYDEEWFVIRCNECGQTHAFDIDFIVNSDMAEAEEWAIREVAKAHNCNEPADARCHPRNA